ncbi:hypothetical protein [Salmonella enterica]|uniref:hypothetical protein n=1 Tax=Salmonella enterica TaxID=28901 RepID=UPI00111BA7EB|nr:hypothetical protein [Salmonella enterica]
MDHLSQPDNFNLEQFEYQVTQPDTESAARMLLFVLTQLDATTASGDRSFRRIRRVRPSKG